MNVPSLGDLISTTRKLRGLTLENLSENTKYIDPAGSGVSVASISKIENGHNASSKSKTLLTLALGIHPDQIEVTLPPVPIGELIVLVGRCTELSKYDRDYLTFFLEQRLKESRRRKPKS